MNRQEEPEKESKFFNTKLLMVSSALFLGLLGLFGSFLPQEIMEYYGEPAEGAGLVLVQVTGALYLGFAILNWMARGNIIGGIYSRPVALGNFLHFFVVAIMLVKQIITSQAGIVTGTPFIIGSVAYSLFAICFGYLLFAGGKSCA